MSSSSTGEQERLPLPLLSAVPVLLVLPVAFVAGDVSLWMIGAVLLATGLVYGRPDSGRGLAGLGLAAAVWVFAAPDSLSAGSLFIGLLLLTSHVALALRATAPPATRLGSDVVRRWAMRSAVVAAATGLVFVAAVVINQLPRAAPGGAVALGFLVVAGLALLVREETVRSSSTEPE